MPTVTLELEEYEALKNDRDEAVRKLTEYHQSKLIVISKAHGRTHTTTKFIRKNIDVAKFVTQETANQIESLCKKIDQEQRANRTLIEHKDKLKLEVTELRSKLGLPIEDVTISWSEYRVTNNHTESEPENKPWWQVWKK